MAVETTLPDIIVTASRIQAGSAGGSGGSTDWGEPNISRDEVYEQLEQTFPETCGQKSTQENRIDAEFIADREGAAVLNGYVPPDANGNPHPNSGVTIGTGVDLGSRTVADLQRWRLLPALINTLTPYLGLRGSAASAYLASHPLTLTAGQIRAIDRNVHTEIYARLMVNYHAGSSFNFWRLPAAAQTVLASVALQYGPDLQLPHPDGTPIFFDHMRDGRWQDAVDELRDFGDDFPTRRNLEADVLESAIDNGELPASC